MASTADIGETYRKKIPNFTTVIKSKRTMHNHVIVQEGYHGLVTVNLNYYTDPTRGTEQISTLSYRLTMYKQRPDRTVLQAYYETVTVPIL